MPPRPVRGEHGGLDEDHETKIWMKKKGIEFVRGGSYMQPELPGEAVQALRRELFHDAGTCVRCNSSDHYVAQCPVPPPPSPSTAQIERLPQGYTSLVIGGSHLQDHIRIFCGEYKPVRGMIVHGGEVLGTNTGMWCFKSSGTGKWIFTADRECMAEDMGSLRIDSLTSGTVCEIFMGCWQPYSNMQVSLQSRSSSSNQYGAFGSGGGSDRSRVGGGGGTGSGGGDHYRPSPFEDGLEYGCNSADIAADNMAAHIFASESKPKSFINIAATELPTSTRRAKEISKQTQRFVRR